MAQARNNSDSIARFLALMKIVPRNQMERQQCEQLYLQFSRDVHDRLYRLVDRYAKAIGLEEIPPKLAANMKMILARALRKLMHACMARKMTFLTATKLIGQGQIFLSVVQELERSVFADQVEGHFASLLLALEDKPGATTTAYAVA
jgi:hypothetical protein